MKNFGRGVVVVVGLLALAACSTVSGAGQDINALGHGVSRGADTTASHM